MARKVMSRSFIHQVKHQLLSLRDQVIPPTINVSDLAPGCELALVLDQPKEAKVSTALVLARGYGGFNSALVLRAP